MTGWIKFHRKILDNPIFLKPELYQLFTYCLLKANHSETKIIWNGKEETLKKGCFLTGRKVIARDTGQNESSVYKRLQILCKNNMISVKSNNKFSVVKVLNYCIYQGEDSEKEQQSNNKVTTKEQQSNTDKNDKNVKNDKNTSLLQNKFSNSDIEYILSLELASLMQSNKPNVKIGDPQSWAKHFDLMIRRDKRTVEDIRKVMEWSQKDSFWSSNILSARKLREKFDQLQLKMNQRQDKTSKHEQPKREGIKAW